MCRTKNRLCIRINWNNFCSIQIALIHSHMKKLILMISVMVFSFSLFGQKTLNRSKSGDILIIDTAFSRHNLPPLSHLPDNGVHSFPIVVEKFRKPPDTRDLIFPGASKYYAIMPIERSVYDKAFAIKPDSNIKYFLIVKNPLQRPLKK